MSEPLPKQQDERETAKPAEAPEEVREEEAAGAEERRRKAAFLAERAKLKAQTEAFTQARQ